MVMMIELIIDKQGEKERYKKVERTAVKADDMTLEEDTLMFSLRDPSRN